MPSIIDYPTVLATLERSGLQCVYPRSGAFGLPSDSENHIAGWIAAEDATIRPQMRAVARIVAVPAPASLAGLLQRSWQNLLPGRLWLMPASHWAYELQFGGVDWLASLLGEHDVDATLLQPLSDGSAIEFQTHEADSLRMLVEKLFNRLTASDFTVAFPGTKTVAMLHHHQQIWWQTGDRVLCEALLSIADELP